MNPNQKKDVVLLEPRKSYNVTTARITTNLDWTCSHSWKRSRLDSPLSRGWHGAQRADAL